MANFPPQNNMTPSKKSPEMEKTLTLLFGFDRSAKINVNSCVICNKPATQFKDSISEKEFSISGMCQSCQDEVFNSYED